MTVVQQLSIFGVQSSIFGNEEMPLMAVKESFEDIPFEVNDNVRVIVPKLIIGNSEDHFYLLGFEKKRGIILKVVHKPLLQYHVDFDGSFAIVGHEELKYW